MSNTCTENNCLLWLTEDLICLHNPLVNNVARKFHSPFTNDISRPFASHLLCPRHVYLFGDIDFHGSQPLVVYQPSCRGAIDDIGIDISQPLGKRGSRKPYDFDFGIILDEFSGLLTGYVALVHNQEINLGEVVSSF